MCAMPQASRVLPVDIESYAAPQLAKWPQCAVRPDAQVDSDTITPTRTLFALPLRLRPCALQHPLRLRCAPALRACAAPL